MESTKKRKNATLANPGTLLSKELISTLSLGILLMERRGRKIRAVRKTFRLEYWFKAGKKSSKETRTTKKSSQFQTSRKYDFLCTTNPIASILTMHSIKNTADSP